MCLSPQQVVSGLMIVRDNGGKVNEVLFAVGATHTNGREKVTTNEYYYQWCQITMRCEVPMENKRCAEFTHGKWRPIDNVLVKGKTHQAKGSEQDLFMTHIEVLKPTKRQRLTRE